MALDEQGGEVPGLRIEPARATVRISVARDLANATLPVVPRSPARLPRATSLRPSPSIR